MTVRKKIVAKSRGTACLKQNFIANGTYTVMFQSPNGTVIEMQFEDKYFGFPAYSDPNTGITVCQWNHVELRLQVDLANSGFR